MHFDNKDKVPSRSQCLRSIGGCPRERGCADGIFLNAMSVRGTFASKGESTHSCWELGHRMPKGFSQRLKVGDKLSQAGRAVIGPTVTVAHPREECDNHRVSEKQIMVTFFSWKREGIDGGEFGPPGFCLWGKDVSPAVPKLRAIPLWN